MTDFLWGALAGAGGFVIVALLTLGVAIWFADEDDGEDDESFHGEY